MPRSKGAAARRRKAAAARKAAGPPPAAVVVVVQPDPDAAGRPCPSLSLDVLANIHARLPFLDRLAFASVFGDSCYGVLEPCAPCLLIPGRTSDTARLFLVAERRAAAGLLPAPAMRDHLVIGSHRGWLATADDGGQIYLANPTTGSQHALPHIATMGVFSFSVEKQYNWFSVVIKDFLAARYGGGPPFPLHSWGPEGYGTFTHTACQMRMWFYRKVVLSDSPRPGTYAAMLILDRNFGAPAFATAEDPAWRLAQSPDGVEDAIFHHDGRFYSVSYTGLIESWERDAETGSYKSTPVAPRLAVPAIDKGEGRVGVLPCPRKYLAVSPDDGRLMVVLKYSEVIKVQYEQDGWWCAFRVHVLGDGGVWEATTDIGEAALFVGVNNSMCVSTRGRPEIKAGCVYYTDDDLGEAAMRKESASRSPYSDKPDNLRDVGMYSLKLGKVIGLNLGPHHVKGSWPPPAWMTPSIP